MLEVISAFWSEYGGILLTGTRDTLVMVLISTLFAYLVGDDDHRDPQLLVQFLQKREDGIGGGGVQRGGGFVAEKHLRVRGQRPGDGYPLLLTAGELGGIGACLFLQSY